MTTAVVPPEAPATAPDSLYEVVGDQVVEKPPMGAYEATLASLLFELIGPFARSTGWVRWLVDFFSLRLKVDRDRRPDLAFVSVERWPILLPGAASDRRLELVPDLAIEIISPTNTAAGMLAKVREYLKAVRGPSGWSIPMRPRSTSSMPPRRARAACCTGATCSTAAP